MRLFVLLVALFPALPVLAADIHGVPRIVDGDTVEIAGTKIRLEGLDAPETDQLCLDAHGKRWTCGIEARDRLQHRFGGKAWTCKVSGQDRYGRSLATCYVGAEEVDRWMDRSGWALAFVRYSQAYVADEAAARTAHAGLWAGAFIAPWDWRSRTASTVILGAISVPVDAQKILLGSASASEAPDPHCTIKGNTTRAGQCIFHVEGQRFYARTSMEPGNGRRWFCTEREAEAARCRKAKL